MMVIIFQFAVSGSISDCMSFCLLDIEVCERFFIGSFWSPFCITIFQVTQFG